MISQTLTAGGSTTADGHPLNLASGYKYGYFRIRDFLDSVIANVGGQGDSIGNARLTHPLHTRQ